MESNKMTRKQMLSLVGEGMFNGLVHEKVGIASVDVHPTSVKIVTVSGQTFELKIEELQ